MEFEFENLGPLKNGKVEIKDLTIICGENNSGKTYLSYALYGLYKNFSLNFRSSIRNIDVINKIEECCYEINLNNILNNIDNIRNEALNSYSKSIHEVFNVDKKTFKNLKLNVKFDDIKLEDEVFFEKCTKRINEILNLLGKDVIVVCENGVVNLKFLAEENEIEILESIRLGLGMILPREFDVLRENIFMLPAERSGINIFFKELNINRNNELFGLNKRNKFNIFLNKISKYSMPISDYINFLNSMDVNDEVSYISEDLVDSLEKNIIGGRYIIDKDSNIRFSHNDFKNSESIEFHIASSTAKTLFSLDYYIKHKAEKGDILIIDEPELNLHPDNQRRLSRLLARLVNKGIKLVISTHSDYIIKEFNNLILLGRKFKGYEKLAKKYGYIEDEMLNEKNISAYILCENKVTKANIEEEGIIMGTFDDVINSYNKSSDDIYYAYDDTID